MIAPSLFNLDASRLPDVLRRLPAAHLLGIDGADRRGLMNAVSSGISFLGTRRICAPLGLPFILHGEIAAADLVDAMLMDPFPMPHIEEIRCCVEDWLKGEDRDALDALWSVPGRNTYGYASSGTRSRGEAVHAHPLLAPYMRRSLRASADMDASLIGVSLDPLSPMNSPGRLAPNLSGVASPSIMGLDDKGVDEPWHAFALTPAEAAHALPGWPDGIWGLVVSDGENSRWRAGWCHSEDEVADAVSGRAVWPPLRGSPSWFPDWLDEVQSVTGWLSASSRMSRLPQPLRVDTETDIDW